MPGGKAVRRPDSEAVAHVKLFVSFGGGSEGSVRVVVVLRAR